MIQENVNMSAHTTLRLGGIARYCMLICNEQDIISAHDFCIKKDIPFFVLGSGSNIVVSNTLQDALVVKMENKGITIIHDSEESVLLQVSAGEMWDEFVAFSLEKGLSGIEALSKIPGTCGATPVQNIGAYGQEVGNVIDSVRIYNTEKRVFEVLRASQCAFSYRDSVFKHDLKGTCIIESVIFRLSKKKPKIPTYQRVEEVLVEIQKEYSQDTLLLQIRRAIEKIRSVKLPDPKTIANVGSFFKNPLVDKVVVDNLKDTYPTVPFFVVGSRYKIPAGWLIEKIGYKGYEKNGVGVYKDNALVLVNTGSNDTQKILDLAFEIKEKVEVEFGIVLEIEPEIVS